MVESDGSDRRLPGSEQDLENGGDAEQAKRQVDPDLDRNRRGFPHGKLLTGNAHYPVKRAEWQRPIV